MPRLLTPKVRFNLNRITNGEGYVIAIFHYGQGVLRFNPGAKIEKKHWDATAQRPKYTHKHPEYADAKQLLNEVENCIMDIWRETKGQLSVDEFRNELEIRLGRKERPVDATKAIPTLPEYAQAYTAKRKDAVNAKRGTWKILQTVANYLDEFASSEVEPLTFERIDHNFAYRFTNWMYTPPREFSTNYAAKVLSVVRQFFSAAREDKLHQLETPKSLIIKSEKVTKLALTVEELEHLYNLDLTNNSRLEKVRDLFLIGCYTGLRFSDFNTLAKRHLIEYDGVKMLEVTTQKTGTPVTIPVVGQLEVLLEKYNYAPPKISNQKMNDYLKELCELAGMTEKVRRVTSRAGTREETEVEKYKLVSTHVARRSFATNMFLEGYPAINIMKITGHANERQFMAYIVIDDRVNARKIAKHMTMKKGPRYLKKID